MTRVTIPGLEIMETCGACGIRVILACAVWAIAMSSAGGMAWSAVPMAAQDGVDFQAGTPDFWLRAMVDSGSCVAASTCCSWCGRPLAMHDGNTLCLR